MSKETILKEAGVLFIAILMVLPSVVVANNNIKIEDTLGCGCEGCELEIELIHHIPGITMIIRNVGDADCTNVNWSIRFDGVFIPIGRETTGTIPCIPPETSITVGHSLIFGFGRTTITMSVDCDEGSPLTAEQEAFIILFFIFL